MVSGDSLSWKSHTRLNTFGSPAKMAQIHDTYDLKLSNGKSVKAHVCTDTGHILMLPMCHLMGRGKPHDPWRRGRDIMKQVAKAVAKQTDVHADSLMSLPSHGQLAMHHSLVVPYVLAIYDSHVDAEDLRAMTDACEVLNPLPIVSEPTRVTPAMTFSAAKTRTVPVKQYDNTEIIYVGGDDRFPVRRVPEGEKLEFHVSVNDFVTQVIGIKTASAPNWMNGIKQRSPEISSLPSSDWVFPDPLYPRTTKVMNPRELVKILSMTGSKKCRRLQGYDADIAAILEGNTEGSSNSELTKAILTNHDHERHKGREAVIRDALAATEGGKTEVRTSDGHFADIVTEREVIEVKLAKNAMYALGQVLYYIIDWPQHTPRVHLFGTEKEMAALDMERVRTFCRVHNVRLTTQTILKVQHCNILPRLTSHKEDTCGVIAKPIHNGTCT